ncbi:hypothetical protein DSOUD_2190 [Desulfuromonas soudanensis]|uniref:BIG2 domain-containing protein n=1 Tax=Desulfuromonas soudanensis TaxID=1603606 RepID=A0A0M4DA55_9BACT|nr:Ig-like domain-containing protein [Desulfuromonas soudanensis]ALC16955.1 hypothetical protein DSOUD_2190 [Desulfuromonas soudanensis]
MRRLLCTGLLLFLAGCGSDDQATRPNDFTPLTSIEIVSPLASIAPLTSIPLQAIGNYSGLFPRDITDRVLWEITTPTLAEFTPPEVPGRVKGLAPGTATLTATLGEISATYDLEITSATITALTIAPAAPTVHKGLTIQLMANGTFSDATSQDLTFDSVWTSDFPSFATVGDTVTSKGRVKGIEVGSADITATFDTASDSTTVTVTAPQLQSITITPANPSVLSIAQTSFTATGHYSDGTELINPPNVTWSSSIPAVATTIAATGMTTTLKEGTTTISASLDGVNANTSLQVTGGNLTAISLTPLPTMALGTTQRIFATGSFSNGTTRDITGQADWTVDDSTKATVVRDNSLAWITADAATVALTPATIFAKRGTVEGSIPLTVVNPTLNSLSITPTSLDLTVGTSDRFTVTGTYTGGHTQDLTSSANWSSSAAAVEAFNLGVNKGRVKGVVAATSQAATITAGFGVQTATANVGSVIQRTLQSLAISAQPATFIPGTQVQFTATATYSDNTTHVVTEDTVWSVDKTNVAILADTVNQPGLAVAVDSGAATLTAAFGGKTATRALTVP